MSIVSGSNQASPTSTTFLWKSRARESGRSIGSELVLNRSFGRGLRDEPRLLFSDDVDSCTTLRCLCGDLFLIDRGNELEALDVSAAELLSGLLSAPSAILLIHKERGREEFGDG